MIIRNKHNGYGRDGARQYHKGGDGGAGEARAQEEQRQRRVQQATDKINAIFNGQSVKTGTGQAGAFDPDKTYYDINGNVLYTPPAPEPAPAQMEADALALASGVPRNRVNVAVRRYAQENDALAPTPVDGGEGGKDFSSRGVMLRRLSRDPAMDALRDRAAKGELYEGFEETAGIGNREKLYADQKQAVMDLNKRDIDRQYAEAERQNRFGLARSGLMGGSVDVDSNAQLQEKTSEGLIRAAGIADQAAADLKTQDERTRQSLISMAQSGIDTGTAQTMALRGLDANAQAAQGARQGATIGSLFGDMSQAYLMRQYGQGMNAGRNQNQQWYGVSAPQQTYSGSTGRSY